MFFLQETYQVPVWHKGEIVTNLILRQGDYVKCIISTQGLEEGRVYQIETGLRKELFVNTSSGECVLVDLNGSLTDYADHFAIIRPSDVLPRGISQH